MEALKLKQEGTEVVQFPTTKRIEVASFVNDRNELLKRNRRAKAYSDTCAYKKMKRKTKAKEMISETIWAIFCIGSMSFFVLQLFI